MQQSLGRDRTSKKCGSSQSKSQSVEAYEVTGALLPELLKLPVFVEHANASVSCATPQVHSFEGYMKQADILW